MSRYEQRVNGVGRISAGAGLQPGMIEPDIRLLGPQDETGIAGLLRGLDPSSRCDRFSHVVNDGYLEAHAKRAVADATCILGAFVDGELRGVVELYCDAPHGCAEAAFVVAQDWRRRGLGFALLRAAMQAASGADMLRMIFSRHNWPMRKLADKVRGRIDIVLDEIAVDVALGGHA